MMHVDLSLCQPPALDFAAAAQRDEGRNSELRERLGADLWKLLRELLEQSSMASVITVGGSVPHL